MENNQWSHYGGSTQLNINQVVVDLLHGSESKINGRPSCGFSLDSKTHALDQLSRVLIQEKSCTAMNFINVLDNLFLGLRQCLNSSALQQLSLGNNSIQPPTSSNNQVSDVVVDIVLKANQVLFEMMPDICHQEDLEIQMAQLIPIFIENLGSPKAVVRKSTHKCIGTYVKLTKKIEFVILHIIHTGLENTNSRTRQHSMLVIPALLSLKTAVMEKDCAEMKELIVAVVKRIREDSSEIVSKTGKKLILELQKCYPNVFKTQYIDSLRNTEDRQICLAVMANDDVMLKQILSGQQQAAQQLHNPQFGGRTAPATQKQNKDLSIVGREIMNSNTMTPNMGKGVDQSFTPKEAKQEPKYPRFTNGLLFSFLKDSLVETLADENKQWQTRASAAETIEQELNNVLAVSDRKMDFLPYATPFIGYIMQFIKDINFKICLTAIQITSKLLVLSVVNIKKHYAQLTTTLMEKLSDSKVVIRQAVLKCCGLIIQSNSPSIFAHHLTKYLQHTNWHVREGILYLIANCLIVQNQQDELNNPIGDRPKSNLDQSINETGHLTLSANLISELCQVAKIETKIKIQQMTVDCLALCLEVSINRNKTEQLVMRELGISMDFSNDKDKLVTKDYQLISQIKERQNKESLPTMQIDGSIEFKPQVQEVMGLQMTPAEPKEQTPIIRGSPRMVSHSQLTEQKPPQLKKTPITTHKDENSQMQMRFQQERVQNNSVTASKVVNNQQFVVPQSSIQLQPHYQPQQRQQHSSSAVENQQTSLRETPSNPLAKNLIKDFEEPLPNKSSLINSNIGSGLEQKDNTNSNFDNEKISRDKDKITMWLPSFQNSQSSQPQQKLGLSPYSAAGKLETNNQIVSGNSHKLDRLNATASSQATFVDDGRSINSNTTLDKIGANPRLTHVTTTKKHILKSPVHREQTESQLIKKTIPFNQGYTPEQHASKPRVIQSNELRQRTLENASFSQASPSPKHIRGAIATQNDFISIQQSPRLNNEIQSLAGQPRASHHQQISQSEIKVQQRNMSQSSGAPGGFNVNKDQINERLQLLKSTFKYKNPSEAEMQSNHEEIKSFDNIHDQNFVPKLTKANSEYNAQSRGGYKPMNVTNTQNNYMQKGGRQSGISMNKVEKPQTTHNSFGFSNQSTALNNTNAVASIKQPHSTNTTGYGFGGNVYGNNTLNQIGGPQDNNQGFPDLNTRGPIKAKKLPTTEYSNMKTIQMDKGGNMNDLNIIHQNTVPVKQQRKPPVGSKMSVSTMIGSYQDGQRANSVTVNEKQNIGLNSNLSNNEYPIGGQSSTTHYNALEEPLRNPELQFKQTIENLKSDDWQKVFDGLNIVKRIAQFHKELLSNNSGSAYKECMKSVVKQTDNLRSQVAKNACMTLQVIYSELPTKELDSNIDLVMTALIKKAADTNQFISEQADKALSMVCNACTDTKVFSCLQQQNQRSNTFKVKICMCYCTLIAKLGPKIKNFRDCDKLIRTVVGMLSEGAQEVRNQAKLAILTLKNNFQNGREFDGLLMRCGLNDKQLQQAKKVVENQDFESLSQAPHTKYGVSMRGSSMDGKSASDARRTPNYQARNLAAGSDGFAVSSFSDAQNMQTTFMSGGASAQGQQYGASNGFGMTGSNQIFKKRQGSVSKPVDPQLMEEFRDMIAACQVSDWNKRLEQIDIVNEWINKHSMTVKKAQASKFIQLVDVQCKFIQDNNAKVQSKGLSNFRMFLQNHNLRTLIDQNLTMILQALSPPLASSSPAVRNQSEQLLALLQEVTENPSQLIQPIVAQVNLSTNRSKAPLVERLTLIIQNEKINPPNLVDRYVSQIVKPNNKIHTEANTNPRLKEALKNLEGAIYASKK